VLTGECREREGPLPGAHLSLEAVRAGHPPALRCAALRPAALPARRPGNHPPGRGPHRRAAPRAVAAGGDAGAVPADVAKGLIGPLQEQPA